ncbi:MAG: sigma-70 family RNA polymerase sigma factor [Dehalococcoidia bacterium]|nr:sigma-70 family RNA polymerase sigma factor [Dehalococcoidia bacterium]
MDEQELIQASKKGELDCFNQLVITYQKQVYNFALRMVNRPETAEDITQETFLSAFRSIGSFKGGSFRAWLFRIASNSCYDQMRRWQRKPSSSLEALQAEAKLADPVDKGESPEEHVLRRELAGVLREGLADLPEDQRAIVILSDIQGFSYEEMAEATRTPLGTVKSRLNRGRAHLRSFLLKHGELLPGRFRQ